MAKLVSNTKIYLDCTRLFNVILDITPEFPRAYKFSVGSRMHELAIDLLDEIAAAYINRDRAETVPDVLHARGTRTAVSRLIVGSLNYFHHGNQTRH